MNKLFTKIAALALGATMAVGVGVAVASSPRDAKAVSADYSVEYTLSGTTTAAGNAYATASTVTQNNVGWKVVGNTEMSPWRIGGKGLSGVDRAIYSTSAISANIAKIEVSSGATASSLTVNSLTISVHGSAADAESGSNAIASQSFTSNIVSKTVTFEKSDSTSWAGKYYRIVYNVTRTSTSGNGYVTFNSATFSSASVATYDVTFAVNTAGYGTLDSYSITSVPSGSSITVNSNKVTINGTTITATPTASTAQYTYAFSSWSNASGTITAARTITANFTRTTRTYSVGGTITNGSLSSTANVAYGSALNITINPDSGYSYPSSLTSVTMGGSAYAGYTYNSGTGAFSIASVTGAVVINATCPSASASEYDINYSLSHCSISNPPASIYSDDLIELTIVPADHYKLPGESANKVSVSGAVDWVYSQNDGTITIDGADNDLTVSVECVAKETYDVTLSLTNVTKSSGPSGADSVEEGEEVTIFFAASGNYGLPASITVTMGGDTLVDNDDYVWTQNSGKLWLPGLTDDLSVTIDGEAKTLLSISFSPTSGSYTLGDDFVKPTVTATYNTGAETVTDTENISYSGYNPYSATVQNVTISYGGKTAASTYTATVTAASFEPITTWELTDLADLTSSDEFVIARTSSTTVALPSNGGAAKPTVSSVTISNNKITSTVTDSLLWNVSGNASDGYVFNPKGDTSNWLYLLPDANDGVRIGSGNSANNKHFTLEQGYLYSTETTYPRMIGVYNNADWRCYKLSGGEPGANIAGQTFGFFKKVETPTGSADLIRITASFTPSETKYAGDSISTSDFTVQKQYNTGETLSPVTSGFTISANTLASTHNVITVSYTEGGITETFDVVIDVEEVTANVESVTLVQGVGVVKEYVDWSGAAWDYTGLTVHCAWDDSSYNEDFNLEDLILSGDASVSPAKPSVGVTSFTVSFTYHDVDITSNSVTGISVVADYVDSISWTKKSLSHFKAFSGEQLTASTVSTWVVKATYAGAGESDALSFGTGANQFTIRIGDSKSVTSLPYTWTTADDNQFVYVVVGGVAQGDSTYAKTNICASINAIDHTEIITPASEEVVNAYVRIGSTAEITSGGKYLIVYEGDSTHASVAFDGSLSTLDATSNGQSVSISDNRIAIPANDDFYFTITEDDGAYSIVTADGSNVGHSGTKNGMNCSDSTNHISFDEDGYATIVGSGGLNLRYNYASDQLRFRYYTSTQQQVAIYKYINETIHHDAVTGTTHYANDMDHFDAQKAVVEFAKFMNTAMNGSNVCSGTFANLESAWGDVADKYDELFGASTTLNETELAWAKKMLEYASPVWGSDAEAACVEKAMKTYDYCASKYGLDEFLDGVRTVGRVQNFNPLINLADGNNNVITIAVVISLVSVTAIGGYFFLRKRKEI